MRKLGLLSIIILLAAYTAGCSFSASSKGSSNSSAVSPTSYRARSLRHLGQAVRKTGIAKT